ncbi:MAG: hypothetical protein M0003_02120 [Acidithiobacillus sp.]|nr:hypothetical protein [Acidithiobacillus sp.]
MKLYKRDLQDFTAREVEGEPYPGTDSDGDTCYHNSHFRTEIEAWASLKAEVEARVSMAGRDVAQKKMELLNAQEKDGEAAIAFEKMTENMRQAGRY